MGNIKTKKVFQIQINGITESTDAVKTLDDALDKLEQRIDRLSNAEIKVKVSGSDIDTVKTKVSGGSSGSTSQDDKLALEIEKEKTKQVQLTNEALREQVLEKERLKQANKEELDAIKQQAKGYVEIVDGVKVYDDSLNGMRAKLKDMKQELANMSTSDSGAWDEQAQKVNELNQQIKDLEEQYGVFSRNVGDYYNKVKQALEDWDGDREFNVDFNITGAEGSLNDLKQQLSELKRYWADLSPDDDDFQKAAQAIQSLENQIQDMTSATKNAGDTLNTTFTGRFTTTIGGVEASFSNASEACEALRKKLVAMRVAGEENTPMYTEIIELVRRLQKEVTIANRQVEGMTKTTATLGKTISVMKGLSGLASLGQGIAGLFGGGSKELDEFIRKFASMTMVLSGLQALNEELTKGTSAFAKFGNVMNKGLDWLFGWADALNNGMEAAKKYGTTMSLLWQQIESGDAVQHQIDELHQVEQELYNVIDDWDDYLSVTQSIPSTEELISGDGKFDEMNKALDDLKQAYPEASEQIEHFREVQTRVRQTTAENAKAVEEYRKALEKCGPVGRSMATWMGGIASKGPRWAAVIKGCAYATQFFATALKTLGKATVVIALLQLLAEGIEILTEKVTIALDWMKGLFGYMGENEAKQLASDLELVNQQLDAMDREIDIQIKLGNMGEIEGQIKKLDNSMDAARETQDKLFSNDKIKEWHEELTTATEEQSDEMQKFNEKYDNLGKLLANTGNLSEEFWAYMNDSSKTANQKLSMLQSTLGLTGEQLAQAAAHLTASDEEIEKWLDDLAKVDWDLNDIGVDGVKAFGKLITSLMNVRTQTVQMSSQIQAEIDRLNGQNITITASLDPTNFYNQLAVLNNTHEQWAKKNGYTWGSDGHLYRKDGKSMTPEEILVTQLEEKNRKLQEQQMRKQVNDRLKQQREAAAREAKQRANQAKQQAKQAAKAAQDAQNRANDARIAAMKEGRAKELAAENERFRQLKQGHKVSQAEIALHNKKIADINAEWDKKEQDAAKEHADKILEIQRNMFTDLEDLRREKEDLINDSDMGKAENAMRMGKNDTSFDTDNATLQDREKYYDDLMNLELDYIKEKERIEKLAASQERNRRLNDAVTEFNDHLKQNDENLRADLEEVDERIKAGIIKEEQGNVEKEAIKKAYHEHETDIEKAHKAVLAEIEAQSAEEITKIQLDALEDRQDAVSATFTAQIAEIQTFYSDIDSIMEANTKKHTNQFGLINFSDFRNNIKEGLQSAELAKKEFEKKKKELQDALNQKKISFDDFKQMNKELDDALRDVEGKVKDMKTNLSMALNNWLSSSMESIMQYTDVMQSLWDTFSNIQTMKLDEQSKELEARQKLLDEELKMIEDNYNKQEEITRKHKEKVDSLEDELADSRGDRRQALIDALAEERRQQEKSIEQEKKLTKEKKANAAKQEQIKKQQDALEKKRREQEKQASIVQATISTFAAVANALSLQPFWVGLAMSAVALTLGMAQVAAISSQKYADGGLLNGKPHSQGGIPVGMTGIEVEGGEYVTNKASTRANLPLLEYINSNRRTITKEDLIRFYDDGGGNTLVNQAMTRRFADGGIMPSVTDINVRDMINYQQAQDDRPVVVSVVDINDRMENLRQVEVLAGMR